MGSAAKTGFVRGPFDNRFFALEQLSCFTELVAEAAGFGGLGFEVFLEFGEVGFGCGEALELFG
jgi:hypothetical protein